MDLKTLYAMQIDHACKLLAEAAELVGECANYREKELEQSLEADLLRVRQGSIKAEAQKVKLYREV